MTDEEKASLIRILGRKCGSLMAAARVLPLVAWDIDLARDYLMEEAGVEDIGEIRWGHIRTRKNS